jgi:uncharacterized protein YqeY
MSPESSNLRQALRDALPGAMNSQDTPARDALRLALAAVENAEAVSSTELDDEHILEIVTTERNERLAAADDYRKAGAVEQAEQLEAEAAALDAFLC